jgi:hypothetical protein
MFKSLPFSSLNSVNLRSQYKEVLENFVQDAGDAAAKIFEDDKKLVAEWGNQNTFELNDFEIKKAIKAYRNLTIQVA